MAFDSIEPPDLWESATARMLYALVCSWSSGKPPKFTSFFPRKTSNEPMSDDAILAAFGIKAP